MTGRALLAAALLAAVAVACGVKAPPRPPAGATRAPAGVAADDDTCRVAGAAPGDCGKKAATGQENDR